MEGVKKKERRKAEAAETLAGTGQGQGPRLAAAPCPGSAL